MAKAATIEIAEYRSTGLAAALVIAVALTTMGAPAGAWAKDVRVAVASNFVLPLRSLKKRFEKQSGDKVLISSGSTGGLYAQIVNGAPFDILLAADAERPRRLVDRNYAVAGSRSTYARGRLVLYSNAASAAGRDCLESLKSGRFKRIAIASPRVAPYGIAARQTLEALGLWSTLRRDLVRGGNISQVFQWVETGHAGAGLVALSQVVLKGAGRGCQWLVPADYHMPLEQQVVLLVAGAENPAARRFMDFLSSPRARTQIREMGYGIE